MTDRQTLALCLKQARIHRGIKPIDVCEATGLPYTTFWRIESGKVDPKLIDVIKLLEVYDATLEDVLG